MNQALLTVDSNQSWGADYISPPFSAKNVMALNIQAIWAGSPLGTLTLETSLDYSPGGPQYSTPPTAGNWATYKDSSQVTTGVNTAVWDIFATGARWFRVHYIRNSATGTMTNLLVQIKG